MSDKLITINFHGQTLTSIKHDEIEYVAMRPIVEHLGLAWQRQQQKLTNDPDFNCHHLVTVARDGKERKMLCLPVRQLPSWLFSVNRKYIRSDYQELLRLYKEESQIVLHNHWTKGQATNPRFQTQQLLFDDSTESLVSEPAIPLTDAWKVLVLSGVLGPFVQRQYLLSLIKRGSLKGHKNALNRWMVDRAAFGELMRKLKLRIS